MSATEKSEGGESSPPAQLDPEATAERLAFMDARLARLSKELEALAEALRKVARKNRAKRPR